MRKGHENENKFGQIEKDKGENMCLSKVYLSKKEEKKLSVEETCQVLADEQGVQVNTLIGDSKRFEGYFVREIDFMENYVILERKKSKANA